MDKHRRRQWFRDIEASAADYQKREVLQSRPASPPTWPRNVLKELYVVGTYRSILAERRNVGNYCCPRAVSF